MAFNSNEQKCSGLIRRRSDSKLRNGVPPERYDSVRLRVVVLVDTYFEGLRVAENSIVRYMVSPSLPPPDHEGAIESNPSPPHHKFFNPCACRRGEVIVHFVFLHRKD
ncbi:hypothetical protein H6P81_008242 [Aristolochia fimbriata]|uniref:Uncharacterized protein n=1 Tax=Aristolochia fimbriata TaxID=158543 RepID=A0AAV7F2T5_ARIFI|nr:hypothetical protein H6P81_008242 [Aristolochia fimbriata]